MDQKITRTEAQISADGPGAAGNEGPQAITMPAQGAEYHQRIGSKIHLTYINFKGYFHSATQCIVRFVVMRCRHTNGVVPTFGDVWEEGAWTLATGNVFAHKNLIDGKLVTILWDHTFHFGAASTMASRAIFNKTISINKPLYFDEQTNGGSSAQNDGMICYHIWSNQLDASDNSPSCEMNVRIRFRDG